MSKKQNSRAPKVELTVILSDIHLEEGREHPAWYAAKQFVKEQRPTRTILAGDLIDLVTLSPYANDPRLPNEAVRQVKMLAREANELQIYSPLTIMLGNHEARWDKVVLGGKQQILAGAKGLDFRSQLVAQGLSPAIEIARDEGVGSPGVFVGSGDGRTLIRHGDKQSNRFGPMHIAHKLLTQSPHVNQVVGHHHRKELRAHTSLGKTRFAVANGCLAPDHGYSNGGDPQWQRGFTILQHVGDITWPHTILIFDGKFVWERKLYDGNKARRRAA